MASPPTRGPLGRRAISGGSTPSPVGGGAAAAAASGRSPPSADPPSLARLLWQRRVPLIITHASLVNDAAAAATTATTTSPKPPLVFATSIPRFGYLAQLLPRLTAFFGRPCSSFHYEDVPLRNLPVGLLVDLYRGGDGGGSGELDDILEQDILEENALEEGNLVSTPAASRRRGPWSLVVSDGEAWHLGDTFLNGAKEADYVRYGSAKQILGLSKANTEALWDAVQDNDYAAFFRVSQLLLNAPTPLKHIPLRIFIPSSAPAESLGTASPSAPGSYKIMQALVTPRTSNRQPQTLGPALRTLLPLLFPSSRDPVLANVILHGAPVPFQAPLEELMREAAYPDGWLCLIVVLL